MAKNQVRQAVEAAKRALEVWDTEQALLPEHERACTHCRGSGKQPVLRAENWYSNTEPCRMCGGHGKMYRKETRHRIDGTPMERYARLDAVMTQRLGRYFSEQATVQRSLPQMPGHTYEDLPSTDALHRLRRTSFHRR